MQLSPHMQLVKELLEMCVQHPRQPATTQQLAARLWSRPEMQQVWLALEPAALIRKHKLPVSVAAGFTGEFIAQIYVMDLTWNSTPRLNEKRAAESLNDIADKIEVLEKIIAANEPLMYLTGVGVISLRDHLKAVEATVRNARIPQSIKLMPIKLNGTDVKRIFFVRYLNAFFMKSLKKPFNAIVAETVNVCLDNSDDLLDASHVRKICK